MRKEYGIWHLGKEGIRSICNPPAEDRAEFSRSTTLMKFPTLTRTLTFEEASGLRSDIAIDAPFIPGILEQDIEVLTSRALLISNKPLDLLGENGI